MRNIRFKVAYDGGNYAGWQKNRELPTVELCLENVLVQILQHPVHIQAASRTDAGVHAVGQIVNFFTEKTISTERLLISCNALLPKDIRILNASEEADSFHPTLDNTGKEYHYTICFGKIQNPIYRNYSWHFPHPLDLPLMQHESSLLLGEHDFSFFRNQGSNSSNESSLCHLKAIRIIDLGEQRLRIEMVGSRFLYKMARNIAGTLAYLGSDKLPPETLETLLKGGSRPEAGMTAPAHGLVLVEVFF